MADPRSFGTIISLIADAVGQPGQRRFRLRAMNDQGRTVSLWLEKEQLIALGDAIETVLKDEEYEHFAVPMDDREQEPVYPLNTDVEFRIGQLSMGISRDPDELVVIGIEATAEGEEGQTVMLAVGFPMGFELRQRISVVVASGRPPCPLCTAPLDADHVCPKKNGHHKQG
jgi:uncharacterized repeat protein (TIGR03847 family)